MTPKRAVVLVASAVVGMIAGLTALRILGAALGE